MSGRDEQPPDIGRMQENFSKQQKKISALKELVRKTESSTQDSRTTAQAKVKNIAQRLTHIKAKARSRHGLNETQPGVENVEPRAGFSQQLSLSLPMATHHSIVNPTPPKLQKNTEAASTYAASTSNVGNEKILLLRQQMEENKARMAQRASSKLHLEKMVSELKEKFDTTQQTLEDTTELGKSVGNLSALVYVPVTSERHKSATDLTTQPFSLERERIKFLENRCRLLEKQLEKERLQNQNRESSLGETTESYQASLKRVKELEESATNMELALVARQQQWEEQEARVIGLTSELAALGSIIDAKDALMNRLEQDKLNTDKSYETTHEKSDELIIENTRLQKEIADYLKRIAKLETDNDVLETVRADLLMRNDDLKEKLEELRIARSEELRTTSKEHITRIATDDAEDDTHSVVASKMSASDTDSQVKAEMAKQIQELQDQAQKLRNENAQLKALVAVSEKLEVSDVIIAEKIEALEATIEAQREDLKERLATLNKTEEELMEKTIELNVLNANFKLLEDKLQASSKNKPLFSAQTAGSNVDNSALESELKQLKQKLDESNKAMIKLKLKCKQLEKQVEKLQNNSELHEEVVRLQRANDDLQQKVIELEDEKGQWQLTHMDDHKAAIVEPSEALETELKTHAETIRLLEQQKFEQSERIATLQQELQTKLERQDTDESARVKSQMSEIHLEEELEEHSQHIKTLQEQLSATESELDMLKQKLSETEEEKSAVSKKLQHYINENMELLDKVEKLSKSSSSAESIEIVERLTQLERAELDEFNKRLDSEHTTQDAPCSLVSEITQTEMNPELSESLAQLREESSELMNKIELFTTERREVLEKMEHLTNENQDLIRKIEELTHEKEELETNNMLVECAKSKLEDKLGEVTKEKDLLASQVAESNSQKGQLSQELTSLQKSSEVVAALDSADGATLFDKCEKSLTKLNSELEAYRKANDKNAKFNASKKLAKEAKNAYTQLTELLQKVKEASNAVETVTVVETVVAVTAPNGKALAEYEQLTAQNRELKAVIQELRRELEGMQGAVNITSDDLPAISQEQHTESEEKLRKAMVELEAYNLQCVELQSTVEDLRLQLQEARLAGEERSLEAERSVDNMARLSKELAIMRKMCDDFDCMLNEKETAHERQIEQLTRVKRELEGKCETYEGEMEILQTLVTEQKQQIIEAYRESEHDINLKLLDLQQREETIEELRAEIRELKEKPTALTAQHSEQLQKEMQKLQEQLKINKALLAEQVNELANKQETIDSLNQQIIDLYQTMEENTDKLIEREDKIMKLEAEMAINEQELERLRRDNEAQKAVVDKLLTELHSHKANTQHLPQLEEDLKRLQETNKELEALNTALDLRNKEQLEKLKKYAANLKKRTAQCQEFEAKIKELEKGSLEAMQTKADDGKLDERIADLEAKLQDADSALAELHEALQVKTMEQLEGMETAGKLEAELQQMQESLQQKSQEVVQLQNALAASQEQISDWSNTERESNLAQLAGMSNEVARLNANLKQSQNNLLDEQQTSAGLADQVKQLHEKLISFYSEGEKLQERESDYIECLEKAEADAIAAQNEILQLREKLREAEQAIAELKQELQQKTTQKSEQQMIALNEELKAKSLKFEKSKAVIKERNNQIKRLQEELKNLQDKLSSTPEEEPIVAVSAQTQLAAAPRTAVQTHVTKDEHDNLQQMYQQLSDQYAAEKANFQQTIQRLETLHDGIQAKLQEDMSYIETLEQENAKFKEKICKLEECVATFEERRASMERRADLLDAQMQTRADEYKCSEDELIYRLNMLSEHDDVIAQRLLKSQEEKEEVQERLALLQQELNEVNAKYSKMEKEYQSYREEVSATYETENMTLRQQLTGLELEMERLRSTYEAKLAAKSTEIDEMECELSDQLEKMNADKRAISEDLERARDSNTELKDEIVRLNESLNAAEQIKQELERESTWLRLQQDSAQEDLYELQELRMQFLQDRTEMDNMRHQIVTQAASHDAELQGLRTQIAELDTLRMQVGRNQTDDQVFIESENKRLTDLLVEKDNIITQMQMAMQVQTEEDPLSLFVQHNAASAVSMEDYHRLERELAEKCDVLMRLQRDLDALQTDYQSLQETKAELTRQLHDRNRERDNNYFQEVLPAPPMFFAAEPMAPTPFDEIVQARAVEHALGAAPANNSLNIEQPTIEDLQRNVSDLDKHAQDLENKLVACDYRESVYEEKLRESQGRHMELEERLVERDQQLRVLQGELQRLEQENAAQKNAFAALRGTMEQLQLKYEGVDRQLQTSQSELNALRKKLAEEQRLRDATTALEQQILSAEEATQKTKRETKDVHQPTLEMFFGAGGTTPSPFESLIIPEVSDQPVIEEVIVPKKAYTCQPHGEEIPAVASVDVTSLELGDVWGDTWGAGQEASEPLIEPIVHTANIRASLLPREQQLDIQLQEQTERIEAMQKELARCNEEKAEIQVKTNKLMKKLKEYKMKIDELTANKDFRKSSSVESNSMFNDLDATIQEELKTQLKKLEAKLQEQQKVQETQLAEREKLLKRIDVLTAGNERMSEMKERQDMEVQMYQARIRELQQKLNRLEEWGAENNEQQPKDENILPPQPTAALTAETDSVAQKVAKLTAENQDLNDDRAELQALLEDEKTKAAASERELKELNSKLGQSQSALEETKAICTELEQKLKGVVEQHVQEQDRNSALSSEVSALKAANELLSAAEQQLKAELLDRDMKIQELQAKVLNLETQLTQQTQKLDSLKGELEKNASAADLTQKLEAIQKECEELRRNKELLESELRSSEKQVNQADLADLQTKLVAITQEKEEMQQLKAHTEQELAELAAKFVRLEASSTLNQHADEIAAQLQEKEAEIVHLKQRIEDLMREDQTEKLVLEILTKNQEIHMLKMRVKHLEDDKLELEHNLTLQITNEMQTVKNVEMETKCATLAQESLKLSQQVQELEDEKSQMEEELKVLNNHVMATLDQEEKMKATMLELDVKNIEIAELRKSLETIKQHQQQEGATKEPQVDFVALNSQWEALIEQRCGEIAQMWRAHLDAREKEFKAIESSLEDQIEQLRSQASEIQQQDVLGENNDTSSPASESGSTSAALSKAGTPMRTRLIHEANEAAVDIMEKMQAALESQEIEIVTLKEQLAIRSAEYARLAAQYDPFKLQTTLSHSGMSTATTPPSLDSMQSRQPNDGSMVPKSELDLALYMLHQRDMRCEEMTLELVNLLEERDTLQLKLSNTLRQIEAIKRQSSGAEVPATRAELTTSLPEDSPAKSAVAGTTAEDSENELNQKLSQLQTVNHSKDKIIKEQRDQRIWQIQQIQQDVAKMPPAALTELVGTDLSRSNQSPSSTLLNWLWGNKPDPPAGGVPPN